MQVDKAKKEAMMDELKHYINGKFEDLKKELFPKPEKLVPMEKAKREKATRG